MLETAEAPQHETHTVFNQSTPLENVNLYEIDLPSRKRSGAKEAGWAEDRIKCPGRNLWRT